MSTALAILTFLATTAAAVAAFLSWRAALKSDAAANLANRLTEKANQIAAQALDVAKQATAVSERVAAIEEARHHVELTPEFHTFVVTPDGWDSEAAQLELALVGPSGLGHLRNVEVRVRDDERPALPDHNPQHAAAMASHVWGPWKFTPGVNEADTNGRSVQAGEMKLGARARFQMQRTRPMPAPHPAPTSEDDSRAWNARYLKRPILLEFRCEGDDGAVWTVPAETEQPGRLSTSQQRGLQMILNELRANLETLKVSALAPGRREPPAPLSTTAYGAHGPDLITLKTPLRDIVNHAYEYALAPRVLERRDEAGRATASSPVLDHAVSATQEAIAAIETELRNQST